MRPQELAFGLAATANAASLASVCTTAYAKAALPLDVLDGVTIDASSLSVTAKYNTSVTGSVFYPDSTFDYCNVTVSRLRVQHLCTEPSTYTHSLHTLTLKGMTGSSSHIGFQILPTSRADSLLQEVADLPSTRELEASLVQCNMVQPRV